MGKTGRGWGTGSKRGSVEEEKGAEFTLNAANTVG